MKQLNSVPAWFKEWTLVKTTTGGDDVVFVPHAMRTGEVAVGALRDQPARQKAGMTRLAELVAMAKEQGVDADDEADFESRIITLTASDETVDRYGDVILVDGEFRGKRYGKGWDLRNWRKNPVIMPFHEDAVIPVGTAVDTWTDQKAGRKRLRMSVLSATEDVNPLAPRLLAAVRKRILRSFSVGFLPAHGKIYEPTSEAERKEWGLGNRGLLFGEHELLENSFVSIPANPNAVEGRDAVGLLRLADEIRDVNQGASDQLRDLVVRGTGYAFVDGEMEGPALTDTEEVRDDAANTRPAGDAESIVGALRALGDRFDALSERVEAGFASLPDRAAGEDAGGSRRNAEDSSGPEDLYNRVLSSFDELGRRASGRA